MLRSNADVVVVGAGIVGLCIAYQLARHRAGRVTVLEKGPAVAEGSTGASSAILRQRYSHAELIQLARDGVAAYASWAAFTGLSEPRAEFQHVGVLWMTGESASGLAAQKSPTPLDVQIGFVRRGLPEAPAPLILHIGFV